MVWKAQFEVGSQIQDHLDRALELHRTTDFQISNVSAFHWELLMFGFSFVCFTHAHPLAAAEGHFAQKERRADPAVLSDALARAAQRRLGAPEHRCQHQDDRPPASATSRGPRRRRRLRMLRRRLPSCSVLGRRSSRRRPSSSTRRPSSKARRPTSSSRR